MGNGRQGRRDKSAGGGLERMLQRKNLAHRRFDLNAKVTRLMIPLVAFYLLTSLTFGWVAGVAYSLALVTLLCVVRAAVTNPSALYAVASLVGTIGAASALPLTAGQPWQSVNPGVLLAAIAGTAGAYMTRRHLGSRLVTVLIAHGGCLVAAVVSLAWPVAGGALAFVWVIGVIVLRTGALLLWQVTVARFRSRLGRVPRHAAAEGGDDAWVRFREDHLQAGVEAEQDTAAVLAKLPQHWSVLHSRSLPGTHADVDHLVIGDAGVFVIDSKNWSGKLTRASVIDDQGDEFIEYRINGSMDWLVERLSAPLFEAAKVREVLNQPPDVVHSVVVFTEKMKMPTDAVTLTVYDPVDPATGTSMERVVHLVQQSSLEAWLLQRPGHVWRTRSRSGRAMDRLLRRGDQGVDPEKAKVASERYLHDLGIYADYAMPPA